MPLSQQECVLAIRVHSAALADVAQANLDADVEFCPGWSVRDLVHHVTQVHWFWTTIVEERLSQAPEEGRPEPAADDSMVAVFRAGAERLAAVLASADPADACWTWAPTRQDVGFVIRHQVQEIVMHHWDAAQAAGRLIEVAPEVAGDSVDEFLHVSVSNADDPADPVPPPMGSAFSLTSTDLDVAWVVVDGPAQPGIVEVTVTTSADTGGVPEVRGSATALLLWLYGRVEADPASRADTSGVDASDAKLLQRFRALCFTN